MVSKQRLKCLTVVLTGLAISSVSAQSLDEQRKFKKTYEKQHSMSHDLMQKMHPRSLTRKSQDIRKQTKGFFNGSSDKLTMKTRRSAYRHTSVF